MSERRAPSARTWEGVEIATDEPIGAAIVVRRPGPTEFDGRVTTEVVYTLGVPRIFGTSSGVIA